VKGNGPALRSARQLDARSKREHALAKKIRSLPDERIAQLEDFVDFLHAREKSGGVARLNRIYEKYVKPVEQEHWGEYVLVRPDSQMYFAADMLALMEDTEEMRDPGNCLFKVGPVATVNIL
jgi:hypothetical protein